MSFPNKVQINIGCNPTHAGPVPGVPPLMIDGLEIHGVRSVETRALMENLTEVTICFAASITTPVVRNPLYDMG